MSDNFNFQIIKIIIVEKKIAKNQNFITFVISFVKDRSRQFRSFSMHCKCKTVQPWGALSEPMSLSVAFGYERNPKDFRSYRRKKSFFWFMEKLSYSFQIWKNAYHRDFIQFSVRLELYETA